MKHIALFALSASLALSAHALQVVFSADGKTAGSSPRECPSQGVELATGKVVVGLHALSDARRAACGWYRLVATSRPTTPKSVVSVATKPTLSPTSVFSPILEPRPARVRLVRYSKLLIVRALKAMPNADGTTKWDTLEAKMGELGILDEWNASAWISGDDPVFVSAKPKVAAFLGIAESELDALLSKCPY